MSTYIVCLIIRRSKVDGACSASVEIQVKIKSHLFNMPFKVVLVKSLSLAVKMHGIILLVLIFLLNYEKILLSLQIS